MKSYTDLEQSRKLAKILPKESADMFYNEEPEDETYPKDIVDTEYPIVIREVHKHCLEEYGIPCWSLVALLGVLQIYTTQTAFSTNISVPSLTKTKNGYSVTYVGDYRITESNNSDIGSPIEIVADNPIDACYELILKLNELKML